MQTEMTRRNGVSGGRAFPGGNFCGGGGCFVWIKEFKKKRFTRLEHE